MVSTPCNGVWAPMELSYFTAVASVLLSVFAILGNFLVCIAVCKDPYKKLRTPYMFWIVNLAVTDLIIGCITLPLSAATHFLEALGTKKEEHTSISRTTYFISCTASILNMAAFCVDRFIAIKWPIKYRRLLRAKVCLLIAAVIWVVSCSITTLYFVIGYIDYLFIFAHVTFTITICISGFTFCLLQKLNGYAKQRRAMSSAQNAKSLRKSDRNVTKLFLIILIFFFMCYAPAIVMMYILKFCPSCHCTLRHVLRDLQILFIVSNSAINPFVCTIRLKPFQQALSTIFRCKYMADVTLDYDDDESPSQVRKLVRRLSYRLSSLIEREESSTTSQNNNNVKAKSLLLTPSTSNGI